MAAAAAAATLDVSSLSGQRDTIDGFRASSAPSSSSSCSWSCALNTSSSRKNSSSIRASSSKMPNHTQSSKPTTASPPHSPLRLAEGLASRLGLDLAVAGLERLFSSSSHSLVAPILPSIGGPNADPPVADPTHDRPLRVAYQGARGSYCQEAAAAAFSSLPASRLSSFPCSHMEDAFAAVEDGAADRAVVPAENSLDGPIHRNLDLLLRHPRVHVVGELLLPVNHCLLALPGTDPKALTRVASHPQALAHCRARLAALGLEADEVPNAADAARALIDGRLEAGTAVIGSRVAAREFGLAVLQENLQDPAAGGNYTRFLQLALRPADGCSWPRLATAGGWKATVAFSLEKGPSELFRAMWAFESRGLAVTRMDHRPNRSRPIRFAEGAAAGLPAAAYFDYVFVVDVEGRKAGDESATFNSAVDRLREVSGFVRVLGRYACEASS